MIICSCRLQSFKLPLVNKTNLLIEDINSLFVLYVFNHSTFFTFSYEPYLNLQTIRIDKKAQK